MALKFRTPETHDRLVELPLSPRTRNALVDMGCFNEHDIAEKLTKQTILNTRNLGKGTVREIEAALAQFGLRLVDEDPDGDKLARLEKRQADLLHQLAKVSVEIDELRKRT